MKKFVFSIIICLLFIVTPLSAQANTHSVRSGDSLWKIAIQYGTSVQELIESNGLTSDIIYPGQQIRIVNPVSEQDRELLARLVHAEAKGESYAGKVAVATVVLNRVDHPDFPNTIEDVIYERSASGHYAFSPVQDGAINRSADQEAFKAVDEAIAFRGQGNGSIYFFNPRTATNDWIRSREVTTVIGNHRFAK